MEKGEQYRKLWGIKPALCFTLTNGSYVAISLFFSHQSTELRGKERVETAGFASEGWRVTRWVSQLSEHTDDDAH